MNGYTFESSRRMTAREQTAYDMGYEMGKHDAVAHGRWDDDHKCTVCRKEALCEEKPDPYAHGLLSLFYVDSNYCPNCGAKMDAEERE